MTGKEDLAAASAVVHIWMLKDNCREEVSAYMVVDTEKPGRKVTGCGHQETVCHLTRRVSLCPDSTFC